MNNQFDGIKKVIAFIAIVGAVAGVIIISTAGFGAFWSIVISYPIIGIPWLIVTIIGFIFLFIMGLDG